MSLNVSLLLLLALAAKASGGATAQGIGLLSICQALGNNIDKEREELFQLIERLNEMIKASAKDSSLDYADVIEVAMKLKMPMVQEACDRIDTITATDMLAEQAKEILRKSAEGQ